MVIAKVPGLTEWKLAGRTYNYKGSRIFYRIEGQGEPLLLLHGLPVSSWDWRRLWPHLVKRYRVIAVDLLGCGFSDKSSRAPYGLIEQADLVESLLRHLNVHNYHLVSHDFGDSIAMDLLSRSNLGHAKQSMLSLCLLNGGIFPELQKTFLVQRMLASPIGSAVSMCVPKRLYHHCMRRLVSCPNKLSSVELDHSFQQIVFNGGRGVLAKLSRHIHERHYHRDRWLRALKESVTPVLFLFGTAPQTSGKSTLTALENLVDRERLIELPDVGYFPQLEAPAKVAEELLKFHYRPASVEQLFANVETVEY